MNRRTRIETCDNKGIRLIRNGITFSIQFGAGNYCQNQDGDILEQRIKRPDIESYDAEIAVILEGGEWVTYKAFPEYGAHEDGSVDVVGRVPIDVAIKRFFEFTDVEEKEK